MSAAPDTHGRLVAIVAMKRQAAESKAQSDGVGTT